ncbi:MAG: methionyl-tRNA formyltransferase [Acutalibacteraceae bacterium]|nr:methionyl-tRNA formyltransferase [Acutalibacteraceae bacterium]
MKLVFMGTPDFAVPCLEELIKAGHEIVGVFTQPDKPVGRKRVMTPPPVKVCAEKNGITVYQPDSVRTEESLTLMKELNPDCVVVVAYGKIIPSEMLKLPKLGFVNVHGSLLPKYRGAAPIQWSIIDGEKKTGVTTMQMDDGIDTGDMLEVSETEIGENETAGELFDRLAEMGGKLIVSTLSKLEKGELTPIPQDHEKSNYAKIISKEMALIDFNMSAENVFNLIRGFNPWPIAYTIIGDKRLKVFAAEKIGSVNGKSGEVVSSDGTLTVAFGDGNGLKFTDVQLEGSKRMSATEMLKGRPIEKGTILGA